MIKNANKVWEAMISLDGDESNPDWINIAAIRDTAGLSRVDFDITLTWMFHRGIVHLIPEENQKTLTSADRYNGLVAGGVENHVAIRVLP